MLMQGTFFRNFGDFFNTLAKAWQTNSFIQVNTLHKCTKNAAHDCQQKLVQSAAVRTQVTVQHQHRLCSEALGHDILTVPSARNNK